MIFSQNFIPHLLRCLKKSEYVLFEHFAIHRITSEIPLNFLLRKKDLQKVIDGIDSFSGIGVVNHSNKKNYTEVNITFQDSEQVSLNLWSQLSVNNINLLDSEEVFSRRQLSKSEFYMPNIEHLFEFAILHHFVNNNGLTNQYQSYFEDFHFFVRDGLLDFFNEKYSTNFSNLDDLSVFSEKRKMTIIEELKKQPTNRFFKKMNFQWLNFWGDTSFAKK